MAPGFEQTRPMRQAMNIIEEKYEKSHHGSAEKLVIKNKRTIDRLPDYLDMIRQHGMIPGLSTHMPELILYSDENEYHIKTYIQI